VWLDAGVLPSHIGFESAITTLNATYSRSLIAEYSPYFETGARVTFDAGERVTAAILVVNGWQSIRETNDAKAVGVQLVFRPMDKLVLNYGNYLGDEAADEAGAIDSNRQPDQAVVATGTSTGFEVVGASVNPDHRPADHMLLRLEARLLAADNAVFPGRDGIEKRSSLLTSSMSITF
jgi:hypothetical protein